MKIALMFFLASALVFAQDQAPKPKFPPLLREEIRPSDLMKEGNLKETTLQREQQALLGNEGGGGDPVAAEFSSLATYLADYFEQNPKVSAQVSRLSFRELAKEIKDSLHVSSRVGVIEVDEAEVGTERPPFLEATRTPLFIKISRPQWSRLDEAGRLKATKTFLIDLLSRPVNEEDIPLPTSKLKTYTEAYAGCVRWTKIVRKNFNTYDDMMRTCTNQTSSHFAPLEKKLNEMMERVVPSCIQSCQLLGQKLSGVEICQGYLEQHRQIRHVRGRLNPLCIGT